ncbi:oxidoreductase [Peribacillus sp. B-H-3]|uniref:oxidoreductase n=1 Tax=Peribacillus sp. B-H-3 TaxID=3400420 RepID=UPI003B016AE0
MTLKIGFIGFGKSVTRYHLPYVLIRRNLEVKMIYKRSKKEEQENQYKGHGIEFTDDLHQLLSDEEIQLVSICTPPDTHYDFAKLCLAHGKHVLVEKPFTETAEEARELLDLAAEKNLVIMPYQNRRFDSDFLAMKKVLEDGYTGDIVEIESHFDYFRPHAPDQKGSRYDGVWYGLGVHLIDQAVSLFGRPRAVYYDIRSVRTHHNPNDYYHAELYYDHFKYIVKTNHLVKSPYPSFILHGKNGSFVKYGMDRQEEFLKEGKAPQDKGFGEDEPDMYGEATYLDGSGQDKVQKIASPKGDYGMVYDTMYSTIASGQKKLVSDDDIMTVMEILENGLNPENPVIKPLS